MIYITALPQLYDPSTEGRYRTDEEMDTINQRVAMAIAGQNIFGKYGGDGQGHPDSKVNSHWLLNNSITKDNTTLYVYSVHAV